jgi:ESS family glutamate:Na+ symporter
MNAFGTVVAATILLSLLVLSARVLRRWVHTFDRFFVPTSVIAGLLGLCLGPQVAGQLYPEGTYLSQGIFPEQIVEVWRAMPGILISFVFAGMFLGKRVPPAREIWRMGGPQALLGYTMSFGQYAVGLMVALWILSPLMQVNPLSGVLLEISFSGGHGTAAGLAKTFTELGFPEGQDLALGLATIGLIAGVVLGTLFINYAVRRDSITIAREEPASKEEHYDLTAIQDNENFDTKTASDTTSDPLTLHLGLVAVALILGELLRRLLMLFEHYTYGPFTGEIMPYVPLFPMAMIGGAILQAILTSSGKDRHVSRELINRISGVSLDFIIVAALATMSLASIGKNWQAFVILAVTGLAWTVFCFWVLAPRMLPNRWFEKAIGDFGQGTGMVASGLLLMRIADPKSRSGAFEAFGCKQLVFEPFLGGGVITALALPLCVRVGPFALLVFFGTATLVSIVLGILLFRPSAITPGK